MYLETIDFHTQAIINAAFPGYRGRKVQVEIVNHPLNVKSCWDGGSRDYFTFVNLVTRESADMPAQSAFDSQIAGADRVPLPEGFVCVQHSIFLGKDAGITIYVNPANAPLLLPAPTAELGADEQTVLNYSGYKNTYNGISNYRLVSAQRDQEMKNRVNHTDDAIITLERWEAAKAKLVASGHLDKRGALTARGKNARKDRY